MDKNSTARIVVRKNPHARRARSSVSCESRFMSPVIAPVHGGCHDRSVRRLRSLRPRSFLVPYEARHGLLQRRPSDPHLCDTERDMRMMIGRTRRVLVRLIVRYTLPETGPGAAVRGLRRSPTGRGRGQGHGSAVPRPAQENRTSPDMGALMSQVPGLSGLMIEWTEVERTSAHGRRIRRSRVVPGRADRCDGRVAGCRSRGRMPYGPCR